MSNQPSSGIVFYRFFLLYPSTFIFPERKIQSYLCLLGLVLCFQTNLLAQNQQLDSLYQIWENDELQDTTRLKALFDHGVMLQSTDIDSALQIVDQAYLFAKENGLAFWEGKSIGQKGVIFHNAGKLEEAEIAYKEALSIFEKNSIEYERHEVKLKIAMLLFYTGRREKAKVDIEKSLLYFTTIEKWDIVFRANRLLGQYYSDNENSKMSIEYSLRNVKLMEKLVENPQFEALAHSDLANEYEKVKEYEKAAFHFKASIKVNEKHSLYHRTGNSLYNLVTNELSRDSIRADVIKEYQDWTLVNLEKMDNPAFMLSNLMANLALSKTYEYLGDFKNANLVSKEAIDIGNGQYPHYRKIAFIRAGLLALTMKEFDNAANYCQKAYELNDKKTDYWNTEIICDCLVKSYANLGKTDRIPEFFASYKEAKDSISNIDKARERTTLLLESEFNQEREATELQRRVEMAEQKSIRTGLIIGLTALGLLSFLVFRNNRNKAKANALLEQKNRQISEQKTALERSNHTKDRLFAILGHDLRKPANAFQGIARKVNYLLKKEDYDRVQQLGDSIETNALGLTSLTDNLLKWALTQKDAISITPESLDVNQLIRETKIVLGRLAEAKEITIISEVAEGTKILADNNSMLTIIRNLLDNAIKYTSEGGIITLSTKESETGIDLFVKDNGVGMSQDKTKTIFLLQDGKSTQGTKGEKGTGLGLHLVKELVDLNKGNISVVSQLEKGTTFIIQLPKAA